MPVIESAEGKYSSAARPSLFGQFNVGVGIFLHARLASARRRRQGEWYDAAYQQYLNAESATSGVLLNHRGTAKGIEPFQLWSGSAWAVQA